MAQIHGLKGLPLHRHAAANEHPRRPRSTGALSAPRTLQESLFEARKPLKSLPEGRFPKVLLHGFPARNRRLLALEVASRPLCPHPELLPSPRSVEPLRLQRLLGRGAPPIRLAQACEMNPKRQRTPLNSINFMQIPANSAAKQYFSMVWDMFEGRLSSADTGLQAYIALPARGALYRRLVPTAVEHLEWAQTLEPLGPQGPRAVFHLPLST